MSYLPDPPPAPVKRHEAAPLAGWLRDAVLDKLLPLDAERLLVRCEVLYDRRRAERAALEPVPDLATETAWLRQVLERLWIVDYEWRFSDWQAVDARLDRALRAWEGGDAD